MHMNIQIKLFLILMTAGLVGVISFLLVDLSALIAMLPVSAGTETPPPTPLLKVLSLIQPAVILAVAVLVGVALASKVGLSSPLAEAAVNGKNVISALKPQIVPGIIGGLAGGLAIVLTGLLSKTFLSPEVISRMAEWGQLLPIPTRLLYGGITEELLLRWGLMTFLVWAGWRLFQKGQNKPKSVYFVVAILISSIVFGLGHLPIAFLLFPQITAALIVFVIVANSLFGFIAGYLYWKKGLESAMIAHMLAHIVMLTASYFGAYF
jgi:membrane protease YdiL (CAAX protease family)